jgi:hypothetical protein
MPVIELDKIFWRPGLFATPCEQWVVTQEKLVAGDRWIMDGDLGPYDAVEVRLHAADTIIFWTSRLSAALGEQFADHGKVLISGVVFWHTGIIAVRFSRRQLPTAHLLMRCCTYFTALRH